MENEIVMLAYEGLFHLRSTPYTVSIHARSVIERMTIWTNSITEVKVGELDNTDLKVWGQNYHIVRVWDLDNDITILV